MDTPCISFLSFATLNSESIFAPQLDTSKGHEEPLASPIYSSDRSAQRCRIALGMEFRALPAV